MATLLLQDGLTRPGDRVPHRRGHCRMLIVNRPWCSRVRWTGSWQMLHALSWSIVGAIAVAVVISLTGIQFLLI